MTIDIILGLVTALYALTQTACALMQWRRA